MNIELGELKLVNLRSKWMDEYAQFTPWLAANIHLLNNELGLELEVENTEVSAGPYSADILAKDTGTGKYVVIENQLSKTDHDHLGKAITYASVLDASTIIWIASEFTEQHKKALDWLNDHTSEDLVFYGVKVELWQIDNSKAAVKFNVVSTPLQQDQRAAKTKVHENLTESKKLQLEFWTLFRDQLASTKAIPSLQTPRGQYWFDVTLGKSNIHLSNILSTHDNRAGIRVYISNKIADHMLPFLQANKAEIEAELGETLQWNPNPENRDKIIAIFRPINLRNKSEWPEVIAWMTEKTIKFRKVFSKWVKKADSSTLVSEQ